MLAIWGFVGLFASWGCPPDVLEVKDSIGDAVCACVGDKTVCIPGDVKCIRARNISAPSKAPGHSTLIKLPWVKVIKPTGPSVWPYRGSIQGFRPNCKGCNCVAPCKRNVFIVGCGHSGTTFATRVIGSHPDYHAIMAETGWFTTYGGTQVAFESFRKESVECGRRGKLVLIEKTPKHIHELEQIFRLFPASRVILMVRDGRDVAVSLARRLRYRLDNKFMLCMAAYRWVRDNTAARKYANDNRVHTVWYEDMVLRPKQTIKQLFYFLEGIDAPRIVYESLHQTGNLSWGRLKPVKGAAPTDNGESENSNASRRSGSALFINKHLRNWQVNRPLYDGRGRWITELTDQQLHTLYDCKGFTDLMEQYGYLDRQNKTQWYERVPSRGHYQNPNSFF